MNQVSLLNQQFKNMPQKRCYVHPEIKQPQTTFSVFKKWKNTHQVWAQNKNDGVIPGFQQITLKTTVSQKAQKPYNP